MAQSRDLQGHLPIKMALLRPERTCLARLGVTPSVWSHTSVADHLRHDRLGAVRHGLAMLAQPLARSSLSRGGSRDDLAGDDQTTEQSCSTARAASSSVWVSVRVDRDFYQTGCAGGGRYTSADGMGSSQCLHRIPVS